MTEKKTFKNAMLQTEAVGDYHNMNHVWKVTASAGHGNPYGTFSYEEWDMEVTFTKKVKPLEVGDKVRCRSFPTYSYTVFGQHMSYVAAYDANGDVEIFEDDELEPIR